MGVKIQEFGVRLTWCIWDRRVDETFRPDFKALVGEDIPQTTAVTMNGKYLHHTETITKDQIEKIGNLYAEYVQFRLGLFW